MAIRIIDIAKEAAVSPSAVSLVLNGKPGVSDEVRKSILDIAARLGYKNVPGGSWQGGGEITVKLLKIARHGHIVNEHHNAFITEYIEGIQGVAKRRNCKLEVSFFDRTELEEIIEVERGSENRRDGTAKGLIILGTELDDHEMNLFTGLKQPIVFIDTYFPLSVFDCIDMDNADGVFRSIEYLYRIGHRSIGLVKSTYETRNFRMREAGFREAMGYFSLPLQEKFIAAVDPAFELAAEGMIRFLEKNKNLPTAFFCMNDIIAYGCMKALRERGLRIPEDVSVIGFDDLPSSSITDPPLTTIRVSTREIGERALERLAERLHGQSGGLPEKILIPGRLLVRGSARVLSLAD